MGFEDVLQPAGLFNLVTLLVAAGLWWMQKPKGPAGWVLLVVIAGTGFHFVTDIVADLGADGEHYLMHAIALGAALAAAMK